MINLTFDSKVYDKEVILYVITKYDTDFDIKFKDNNWCIKN